MADADARSDLSLLLDSSGVVPDEVHLLLGRLLDRAEDMRRDFEAHRHYLYPKGDGVVQQPVTGLQWQDKK